MSVPVSILSRPRGFSRPNLKRALDAVLRRLHLADSELSVVIVREPEMIKANKRFFGRAEPTDVISISQFDGEPFPGPGRMLGDVIVSIDAARAQAKQAGHSLQRELRILCVHGLLHNLGMDDGTAAERRAMMAKTMRLLRHAGV